MKNPLVRIEELLTPDGRHAWVMKDPAGEEIAMSPRSYENKETMLNALQIVLVVETMGYIIEDLTVKQPKPL